jgi:hypothetical protein
MSNVPWTISDLSGDSRLGIYMSIIDHTIIVILMGVI